MFEISLSKPPSRNSMFIHLVYNENKIISFRYIFISICIVFYRKVSTDNLSKQHICINVTHANYSVKRKYEYLYCEYF